MQVQGAPGIAELGNKMNVKPIFEFTSLNNIMLQLSTQRVTMLRMIKYCTERYCNKHIFALFPASVVSSLLH